MGTHPKGNWTKATFDFKVQDQTWTPNHDRYLLHKCIGSLREGNGPSLPFHLQFYELNLFFLI